MPESTRRVKRRSGTRGKSRYGCHTCGRIGTGKSMRVVDKRQLYGSCDNKAACLARRLRKLKEPEPMEVARRERVRAEKAARKAERAART